MLRCIVQDCAPEELVPTSKCQLPEHPRRTPQAQSRSHWQPPPRTWMSPWRRARKRAGHPAPYAQTGESYVHFVASCSTPAAVWTRHAASSSSGSDERAVEAEPESASREKRRTARPMQALLAPHASRGRVPPPDRHHPQVIQDFRRDCNSTTRRAVQPVPQEPISASTCGIKERACRQGTYH